MMRTTYAILGIGLSALLGLAIGIVASEGNTRVSALTVLAEWLRPDHDAGKVRQLQTELTSLRQRSNDLEALQQELQSITARVEHIEGADALHEAKRLGIVDAVSQSRPSMHPSAVRRVSIALVSEAKRNNLDPLLLAAVARIESGFNPFATSDSGALGLLQLTPVTGRTLSQIKGERLAADAELYDIETNVALGAQYLSSLLKEFRSVDAALLAYNRGIGGARLALKAPDGRRALQGYPRAVLRERQRLAQLAARHKDSASLSM